MNLNEKKISGPSLVLPLLLLGVASHTSVVMAQSAGTFTATGSMITPRFGHAATLLPNGKVLIAGGATFCGPSRCVPASVAELYDPETGVFTATGSMNSVLPSGGILLADGRVFFAGSDVKRTVPLVEVYDPSSGKSLQ